MVVAPYRAILRYYRCDTPYSAILFKGGWHSPKMVRYPPLVCEVGVPPTLQKHRKN